MNHPRSLRRSKSLRREAKISDRLNQYQEMAVPGEEEGVILKEGDTEAALPGGDAETVAPGQEQDLDLPLEEKAPDVANEDMLPDTVTEGGASPEDSLK